MGNPKITNAPAENHAICSVSVLNEMKGENKPSNENKLCW